MSITDRNSIAEELDELEAILYKGKASISGLLDGHSWQRLIDNYSRVSGLSLAVLSTRYNLIASSINISQSLLQQLFGGVKPSMDKLLNKLDADAFGVALKNGSKVIYKGSFGLLRCWMPIKTDNLILGALWLGYSIDVLDDNTIERDCCNMGLDPKLVKTALKDSELMPESEFVAHINLLEFSVGSVARGQLDQTETIKAEKQRIFMSMIQNSFEVGKNLHEVLASVLESTLALMQAQVGIILLQSGDGHHLVEVASQGFAGDHPIIFKRDVNVEKSLTAHLSENVISREYSFSIISLGTKESDIGIFAIYSSNWSKEDPENRKLMELLKTNVAAGISRTRAYEKVKRHDLLIKASLMQLGRAMGSTLDTERLTRQITQAAMAIMEADLCDLLLIKGNMLEFQVASALNKILKGFGNVPLKRDPAATIIQRGKPLIMKSIRSKSRFYERPWLNREKFKSYIGVPIEQDGKVIGVLEAFSRSASKFNHGDFKMLQSLAGPVAASLHNIKLFDETKKRADELRTLHAHTSRIVAEKDIGKMMKVIVDAARSAVGSLMAAAALYNPKTSHFEYRTISIDPVLGERTLTENQAKKASYNEDAYAEILRTGKPLRLDDIASYKGGKGRRSSDLPLRGFLGAPLVDQDKNPCGLVMVSFKKDGSLFTEADEDILTTLANQASIALQNARLYQDLSNNARALEISNKVGQLVISTLELSEVLDQIAHYTSALLGIDKVGIALIDDATRAHYIVHDVGLSYLRTIPTELDGTLTKKAIDNGGPYICTNLENEMLSTEHAELLKKEDVKCSLSVPLTIFGKELGAIHAFESKERTFMTEEITIMRFFSTQAAIAIENARLYRQLEYRARGLKNLFSVSQKINSSHESRKIQRSIIEAVSNFFGAKSACIALYDEEGDYLRISECLVDGVKQCTAKKLLIDEEKRSTIFGKKKPIIIPDTRFDNGLMLSDRSLEDHFNSFLGVPLIVKNKVIGILGLSAGWIGNDLQLTDELEFIQIFANQVAIAVDNSRLYEEMLSRAENLATALEVSEIITSEIDLTSMFKRIARAINKMFGVKHGCIFLSDRPAERLELAYKWGMAASAFKARQMRISEDDLIGRTLIDRAQVAIDDLNQQNCNTCVDFGDDLKSGAIIPLVVKGKSVGAIMLLSKELSFFNNERLAIINIFTNQCAVAIRNKQLYGRVIEEEVARREAELSVELLEEKAKSSVVIEGTTEGIFVVDSDFKIQLFNPALENMTGKKADRVIGRRCYEVFKDIFVDGNVCNKCPMHSGRLGRLERVKSNIRLKGGEVRFVEIGHSLIDHGGKKGAIGSVRDITKDHELEIYRHDLRVATEVQKNILPHAKPKVKGLDIGFICEPAKQIGGDYFDFIPLDNEKLGIAIGDVAGKSLPAALLVSMHKYILRSAAANTDSVISPLRALNQIIWEDTSPEVFVTTIYGVYNPTTSVFIYANAGHLPPLLYKDGSVKYLWDPQTPLGIRQTLFIEQKKVVLSAGNILVLLSDGVTDIRNNRGDCFGFERLRRIVKGNSNLGGQELADLIYEKTIAFSAGELSDDFTIVVLKCTMDGTEAPINELVVTNKPVAVNDVRLFVAEELKRAKLPRNDASDVLVAVCEAVTNSVLHGQSPDGENNNVRVGCILENDSLKVRISDNGIGYNPNLAEWRPPDLVRDRGRGIFLMQELVDNVEFICTDRGTTVVLEKKLSL
ncbi:MAG: GAF domain-containing protein [Actinobacteria bacterium]|nr:GAF domain-containing protein [Actinomycetota bacterium]